MSALDPFFESYYRLRPVNATFTGIHRYDDRLPDWSPEGLAAAAGEKQSLRAAPGTAPVAATFLGDVAARDRALAVSFLDVQIAEIDSLHFQRGNPSLALGEAVFGIISLITRPFAPAGQRAAALAGRLDALPRFLAGARRSIDNGVPDQWRAKCLHECDGAARLLRDGVARWLAIEALDGAAVVRACGPASAAVEEYRHWLTHELPAAPPDRLSVGAAFFDLLLSRGHHTDRTAAALAPEAASALDEALAALDVRAQAAAPGGYAEVQQRLSETHPEIANYLSAYQQIWEECRAASNRADLVT